MSEDTISVNMNVYDIPIVVEQLKKLEQENKQLKEKIENITTMTVCGDKKQIKNTTQYKLELAEQKIEKAIEFIKEHIRIDDEYPDYMEMLIEERNELLEILGDKENEKDKRNII